MRLRVLPEAQAEFAEAVDELQVQSPEAAEEFAEAVANAFDGITTHPGSCPKVEARGIRGQHRHALVRRFSDQVGFEVRQDELVVKAIAHTSRRPGYWARRRG
jgi:toxin ParE1/3/4